MKKSQQGRFFPEAETKKIVTDRAHTKEIPKKLKPNKALKPTHTHTHTHKRRRRRW